MFDFTTTTFVHNADMIEAKPAAGKGTGTLRIGNMIYTADTVSKIFVNPYVAPSNGKLVVDVAAAANAVSGRSPIMFKLNFFLRRTGDVSGLYSNDMVFNGKDFHYEWTPKQDTAEKVAKMVNKIMRLYGDVYLKVYVDDDKLVFESDNYGIFDSAELLVQVPSVVDCCTCNAVTWETVADLLEPEWSTEDVEDDCTEDQCVPAKADAEGILKSIFPENGAGTYEQLIHDLRLPTMENFRWTSPNASEMPIPGNKYAQYTIHMVACRGVLGGSAVGEVTHSKTTHVVFVPSCGCGEDVQTALEQALTTAEMNTLVEKAFVTDPVNDEVDHIELDKSVYHADEDATVDKVTEHE